LTSRVGTGQKIRNRLQALLGIRLHPKPSDSGTLPDSEASRLLHC